MKVLIADKLHPSAIEILQQSGIACCNWDRTTPLGSALKGFHGLIVRSATTVDAPALESARDLKVVGRAGIGIDNVDVEAATRLGIVVMNAPHGNAVTTAEHTLALLLAMARNLPEAHRSLRSGKWEKSRFQGVELMDKTLGLIGCGNIGSLVAERALALGMRVLVQDPNMRASRAEELGVVLKDRADLLAESDFVSLHAPLVEETRGMVNAQFLSMMRPGARLINCARGPLVVESDLISALRSGHLASAALDVFSPEPPFGSPLLHMDQLVLSPHLGATTAEAQEKTARQMAAQIADFLLHGAIRNALNQPSLSAEEARRLRPWLQLVAFLSGFAARLSSGGLRGIDLLYEGRIATLDTRPLAQVAALACLQLQYTGVNSINALQTAESKGLQLVERRAQDAGPYHSRIVITTTSIQGRQRKLTGTALSGFLPRLLSIDDIPVESEPGKHMLYITHQDRPGLVGEVGSLLGKERLNIATFHLGREENGGRAIALCSLDVAPSEATLAELMKLPDVHRALALRF